jgi:hypothetical protein
VCGFVMLNQMAQAEAQYVELIALQKANGTRLPLSIVPTHYDALRLTPPRAHRPMESHSRAERDPRRGCEDMLPSVLLAPRAAHSEHGTVLK